MLDQHGADRRQAARPAEAEVAIGRRICSPFQTVAELRYGALRRGWGTARMPKLDSTIQRAEVVHTGPELVLLCAQLRADRERIGHAPQG